MTLSVSVWSDRARPTNTFDAHRLLAWALEEGRQEALADRLFRAHFSDGMELGDRATLSDLAEEAGLVRDEATSILDGDEYGDAVRRDEALARQLDVRGVPFFLVADQLGVAGAQPPEVLEQVLRQALDASRATDGG